MWSALYHELRTGTHVKPEENEEMGEKGWNTSTDLGKLRNDSVPMHFKTHI
jgi:hypothetical protein